jgi:AcrR family transcriptional regulator
MRYFRGAMPVLLQLVSHPSFNLAEHAAHAGHRSLHGLGAAVAECLDRHGAQGEIAGGPARRHAATLTLLATLHSLALFERMGIHGGAFPDTAVRGIVDLLVAGLAPREGVRP